MLVPTRGLDAPVLYVHAGPLKSSSYIWSTVRLTIDQGNAVVLLIERGVVLPSDVSGCLADRADISALANSSAALKQLGDVYTRGAQAAAGQLGKLREPQERRNLERFFLMHEYMRRKRLKYAMLLDSDAALLGRSVDILAWMRPSTTNESHCTSAVVGVDSSSMGMSSWSSWAGTSLLSRHTLSGFLKFAVALYEPRTMAAIARAGKLKQPQPFRQQYWHDMLTWYLFAVAADDELARAAGLLAFEAEHGFKLPRPTSSSQDAKNASHPEGPQERLCNLEQFGINNNHVEFMGARGDYHTYPSDMLSGGPFSLYRPELTFDSRRHFWWRNRSVRSLHFWLQKSTVLEILPAHTYLDSRCTLPAFEPTWSTKLWAKTSYLLGLAGARRAR